MDADKIKVTSGHKKETEWADKQNDIGKKEDNCLKIRLV